MGNGIIHKLSANKLAEWEVVASVEDTESASDDGPALRGVVDTKQMVGTRAGIQTIVVWSK